MVLCVAATGLAAQTFQGAEGLYYTITDATMNTVEVARHPDVILNGTNVSSSPYSFGDLTIPSVVTHEGVNYTVTSIANQAFSRSKRLDKIVFPTTMKTLAIGAFTWCVVLKGVQFNDGLQEIGNWAFQGCPLEGTITIPNSVKTLGMGAFRQNKANYVEIGTGVKNVNIKTFWESKALKAVTCHSATPPAIHTDAFMAVDVSKLTLCVPEGDVSAYEAKGVWGDFGRIVEIGQVNTDGNLLTFQSDSLYRISVGDMALTDMGVGHVADVAVEHEILDVANPNAPTLEEHDFFNHAQLWELVAGKNEGQVLFRNYKTGRYMWSNEVLPAAGLSWAEAAEQDKWEVLSTNACATELHMGPNPSKVIQDEQLCYLYCYKNASDEMEHAGCLYPANLLSESVVAIRPNIVLGETWTIESSIAKASASDLLDSSRPTNLDMVTDDVKRPFVQCANRLVFEQACDVYNLMGICVAYAQESEITLRTGVYVILDAKGRESWKVIIP